MSLSRAVIGAALFVTISPMGSSATKRARQPGKVLDADAYEYQTQSGSVTHGTISDTGSVDLRTRSSVGTVKQSQFIIVGNTYRYVVEEIVPHASGGLLTQAIARRKSCRLIIGATIQFAEDRTTLHVIDADRHECRMEILRQERITQPPN